MNNIKCFLRKIIFVYKYNFGAIKPSSYILFNLASPLMSMICFSLLASYANGGSISDWVIGNALVSSQLAAMFGVGVKLVGERNNGTLSMIIAAPASNISVVLPEVVVRIIESIITITFSLLCGMAIFGMSFSITTLLKILLIIVVASYSAMGFGMIISSFALLTRDVNLLLNIASMSFLSLTGANFPISYLPIGLQKIANIMPLTHSIKLARLVIAGQPINHHLDILIYELILGTFLLSIGLMLFTTIEKYAIKHATIDLY